MREDRNGNRCEVKKGSSRVMKDKEGKKKHQWVWEEKKLPMKVMKRMMMISAMKGAGVGEWGSKDEKLQG